MKWTPFEIPYSSCFVNSKSIEDGILNPKSGPEALAANQVRPLKNERAATTNDDRGTIYRPLTGGVVPREEK
jgi:hypothetical protein